MACYSPFEITVSEATIPGIVGCMKHRLYMILSFVALVAILSASYFMVHTLSTDDALLWHRCAFVSFLISALCIEGRVRMGYRLPRGVLFSTHLSAAIPFFVLLGI